MSPSVSVRLLLSQSDERLVGYARAGHERAFEALVQRYRRQLLAYCRRLLLSEQSAEDALQQALLQAWVALSDGAEIRAPRAWLYRVVHNAAVQTLRVSRYDYCQLSESLSGADAPQSDLDRRIAVREALAGLAALPEMQRRALLRTALEGRTHQQAAADLGLSEPALRGLIYRARASLRAATSAIVPPPLIGWALDAGARGAPVFEGVAGVGAAGGGSAGLAGLLAKGGVVAVTAGALAGGIVASHAHHTSVHHARDARASPAAAKPSTATTSARAVDFVRPDNGVAPNPRPAKDGLPPSKRDPRPISALRRGRTPASALPQERPDNHSPSIPASSPPPAGHLHHRDAMFEPSSESGHDGHGGDSQPQATPSGHDEPRGDSGAGGETKREGSGDGGQQSGAESSGSSGLSNSESKGGSAGEGSGEWQGMDGAGWSAYKDRIPISEGSQQQPDR